MSTPKSDVSFPREFKKTGIEQVDWKLVSFGAVVFFVAFGGISFFASLPEPEVDLERIAEMQKRVAQIAMPETPPAPPPEIETPVEEVEVEDVPEVPEVAAADPAPRQSRAEQRASSGGGSATPSRAEARQRRGQARAAAAQTLAQQGVWAQLTTKGGGAATASNFGGNAADLETSLGQVGGVKRGGTSTFDGSGSGAGVGEGAVVGPAGGRSSRGGGDGMDVGSLLGGGVGGGDATSLGDDGTGPGGGVDIDVNAIAGAGGGGPVEESRSDAAVLQVLRQNLGPVRFCYSRELKLNPNLQGSLQLKLTIAANGRVTKTDIVNDTVGSRNLARCVMGRIRSWRFQAAKSNSVVTITLPFSPNS